MISFGTVICTPRPYHSLQQHIGHQRDGGQFPFRVEHVHPAHTQALADAKINLDFFVAQVIGRRYSAVIGFESNDDAKKAAALIKKTAISKRK